MFFLLKDNIRLAAFRSSRSCSWRSTWSSTYWRSATAAASSAGLLTRSSVHYGAIPYELTHPGKHCDLVSTQTLEGAVKSSPARASPAWSGTPAHRSRRPGNRLQLDVPARQLPAHLRQHAVPRDLRAERRGRDRAAALPPLLPARRRSSRSRAGARRAQLRRPTLGASGAIAAVLGGYMLLYPRARVLSLGVVAFFATIVDVPAPAVLSWLLVRSEPRARSRRAGDPHRRRRRRLLRAHRRLRLRSWR